MKWCNKNKTDRLNNWTVIPPPKKEVWDEAKQWCRENESPYRFYHYYAYNARWWFENEKDALIFRLMFSRK